MHESNKYSRAVLNVTRSQRSLNNSFNQFDRYIFLRSFYIMGRVRVLALRRSLQGCKDTPVTLPNPVLINLPTMYIVFIRPTLEYWNTCYIHELFRLLPVYPFCTQI